MQGVEKVIFTCKILLDQRVIELKKENELLKLKLFWAKHNSDYLKEAMACWNQDISGPRCACLACVTSGRASDDDILEEGNNSGTFNCTFKPDFEQKITECGMTFGSNFNNRLDGSIVDDQNLVFDVDCHFANVARADWNCWTYGLKLYNAKSVEDPELKKLVALFNTLYAED
jgi:hypothetical protein